MRRVLSLVLILAGLAWGEARVFSGPPIDTVEVEGTVRQSKDFPREWELELFRAEDLRTLKIPQGRVRRDGDKVFVPVLLEDPQAEEMIRLQGANPDEWQSDTFTHETALWFRNRRVVTYGRVGMILSPRLQKRLPTFRIFGILPYGFFHTQAETFFPPKAVGEITLSTTRGVRNYSWTELLTKHPKVALESIAFERPFYAENWLTPYAHTLTGKSGSPVQPGDWVVVFVHVSGDPRDARVGWGHSTIVISQVAEDGSFHRGEIHQSYPRTLEVVANDVDHVVATLPLWWWAGGRSLIDHSGRIGESHLHAIAFVGLSQERVASIQKYYADYQNFLETGERGSLGGNADRIFRWRSNNCTTNVVDALKTAGIKGSHVADGKTLFPQRCRVIPRAAYIDLVDAVLKASSPEEFGAKEITFLFQPRLPSRYYGKEVRRAYGSEIEALPPYASMWLGNTVDFIKQHAAHGVAP